MNAEKNYVVYIPFNFMKEDSKKFREIEKCILSHGFKWNGFEDNRTIGNKHSIYIRENMKIFVIRDGRLYISLKKLPYRSVGDKFIKLSVDNLGDDLIKFRNLMLVGKI